MRESVLTLFAIPKAFRGEFDVIQQNAIRSWARLRPSCQIVLVGDDEGTREMAAEVGAVHVPEIERNEFGTPLLSSIFSEAEKHAKFPVLCYVNADIVLMSDFLPAIQSIHAWNSRSLIVGRRWDLDVLEFLTGEMGWEALRRRSRTDGKPHPPSGMDYFVFPRGLWGAIPPFVIGRDRGLWDGWLLSRARALGVPVVDASERILAVHQNHGFSNAAGGELDVRTGIERRRNYALGGGLKNACTLRDATYRLTSRGVVRRLMPFDLHRCLVLRFVERKWARPLVRLKKAVFQS